MNLGLVALIVRLDANYLEASAAASERLHERLQRMRRGGLMAAGTLRVGRWRVPRFPWLAGVGPLAWRQITIALRTGFGRTLGLALLVLLIGGAAFAGRLTVEQRATAAGGAIGILAYVTFIVSTQAAFGFRGDLDHMDNLKALPLRGWAVACGEVGGVVLLISSFEIPWLASLSFVLPEERNLLLTAALLAPAFNLFLFGLDGLLFLLYPSRLAPNTVGDMSMFGRVFIIALLKGVAMIMCCGVTGGLGGLAYWLAGKSWVAFVAAALPTAGVIGLIIVRGIAWAFQRFDPSTETPT